MWGACVCNVHAYTHNCIVIFTSVITFHSNKQNREDDMHFVTLYLYRQT